MNELHPALLFGDGLYETVRVDARGPFELDRHIARFRRSAARAEFPEDTRAAGIDALEALRDAEPGSWRVTVLRPQPTFPEPYVHVLRRDLVVRPRPRITLAEGFYVPDYFFAEMKTISTARNFAARRLAEARGFDDAIMTSNDGLVGESAFGNVLAVFEDHVATPPVRGILPGTTRELLLDEQPGPLPIVERALRVDELGNTEEIVIASASVLTQAALSIDGRALVDTWSAQVLAHYQR